MMFGHKHNISCAGVPNSLHPLIGIEFRRIEHGGVGSPVAPFAIQKGIGGKMEDNSELKVLPLDLLRRRLDVREALGERVRLATRESKRYPDR